MDNTARVTVIIPVFNMQRHLAETLESVVSQTYFDFECIVIDDGSVDRSSDIAGEFVASDPRFRLIAQANVGVVSTRINGYRSTSGQSEYIIWLDHDDVLEPDMLRKTVEYLDIHPEVGMVFSDRSHIDDNGNPIRVAWEMTRLSPHSWPFHRIGRSVPDTPFSALYVQDAVTTPSSSLFRRKAYESTSGWDESFGQIFEDWDLVLRIALVSRVHFLPERLVRYRMHSKQVSTAAAKNRGVSQYRKLYNKWSKYADLPTDHAEIVRSAVRFREGRVLPFQWIGWGNSMLRRRRFASAIRCYGVAVKHFGAYVVRSSVVRLESIMNSGLSQSGSNGA